MTNRKNSCRYYFLLILFIKISTASFSQVVSIKNNIQAKQLVAANAKMSITLNYNRKASVSSCILNGQQVLDTAGIYSVIKTEKEDWSSLKLLTQPAVTITGNSVLLSNIVYGSADFRINETWKFVVTAGNIVFTVNRTIPKNLLVNQAAMPVFIFNSINTWEGAYQDYGGLAWFYLFNKPLDTYGVHSKSSQFWNSKTGNGLRVDVTAAGETAAMSYSRTAGDKLSCSIALSTKEMIPRFDTGTNRRLYIRNRTDVWAPFTMKAGTSTETITLSYFDFNKVYGRGTFAGIDGSEVSAVLNTIARIGVIDKQHFGGNSWHTPYGPICLHEQYIAQMGLAINDKNYLKGYRDCLDFYCANAIKPDGRVWPRWAYNNEDMMTGEVTGKGFYEAQWGYLLDSNPDLVSNVAELYDQTGDKAWVKKQQLSCEKALDWILKRDVNGNGLVEMITDSYKQKRGSDWIDIIWSAYENAFVNAKLYHALVLWAAIEKQLNNTEKYIYYKQFAEKLKASFNKPTNQGGFWDEDKRCYIHWRDKDGSLHGNNMVTPVNFMAIGYGLCDDADRIKTILDNIESQMQKEQLFFWPICMYSYSEGEGNDWQFPFPNYENGDIFLSWGALGVKVYASYKPELAVKYVKNVLARYAKDGLAFQRYGRIKQDGLGDDILSGNSLSVVGLYQAIYGINPLYNRFYLNPHITEALAGTKLNYNYRNQPLQIELSMNKYSVSNGQYKVIAEKDFGFYSSGNGLMFFNGNNTSPSLQIKPAAAVNLSIDIKLYSRDKIYFVQTSTGMHSNKFIYQVNDLVPGNYYSVSVNDKVKKRARATAEGKLMFNYSTSTKEDAILIERK